MYQAHFSLKRRPFEGGIAQDAAVYLGPREQRLLGAVKVALTTPDSAIVLTGPAGIGKTTLISAALRATSTRLALGWINSEPTSPAELLELLLTEFGCNAQRAGRVERLQMWRQFLNEMNATESRVFVIAERADDLPVELLRTLDSLTAGDPNGGLGANLVLLGEPGFNDTLKRPALAALRQRIRLRTQLGPFDTNELRDYLRHQLASAGGTLDGIFTPDAIQALHRFSGGSTRLANNLCESALTVAAAQGEPRLTAERVLQTAVELFGMASDGESARQATAAGAAAVSASPPAAATPADATVPPPDDTAASPSRTAPATAAASTHSASTAPPSVSVAAPNPTAAPFALHAGPAPTTFAQSSLARTSAAGPLRPSPAEIVPAAPQPRDRAAPASAAATREAAAPTVTVDRTADAAPAARPAAPAPAPAPETDAVDDSFTITTLVDMPEVPMLDLPVLTDAVEPLAARPVPTPAAPRAPQAPTAADGTALPAAAPSEPGAMPQSAPTPEHAAAPGLPAAPPRRSTTAIERPAFLAPASAASQRAEARSPPAATAPPRPSVTPRPPPAPEAPAEDELHRTQTMRALSVAKSIDEVSDSMAETLFGEADLDMLSAALATAGWQDETAEPAAAPKPVPAPPQDPPVEDPFDWFLAPDAPLELIDDSEPPPSHTKSKVAARS